MRNLQLLCSLVHVGALLSRPPRSPPLTRVFGGADAAASELLLPYGKLQLPSSEVASAAKLLAAGAVQPEMSQAQLLSAWVAAALKLLAEGAMQPTTTAAVWSAAWSRRRVLAEQLPSG